MKSSDGGFTLIETLAAMMILGIAVVIIAGAMSVSIFASSRHREQAVGNALLLQAAENVKSDSVAHVPCVEEADATGYLMAARDVSSLPTGWSPEDITIVDIAYYDGLGFGPTCFEDPLDRYPLALQLITLEVTDPKGRSTERLSFVKGRP